jgi:hypothetical protein
MQFLESQHVLLNSEHCNWLAQRLGCNTQELDDVLIRDVGGKVAATGKWATIIDVTSQASVFLRYMDSNYVNLLSPQHTQPARLRRSLLGSIRYGKPMASVCLQGSVCARVFHVAFCSKSVLRTVPLVSCSPYREQPPLHR